MRVFSIVFFVISLCFVESLFAASTTSTAVVDMQVSLLAILTAALWVFLGVGTQVIMIFFSWRILRIHREIFGTRAGGSSGNSSPALVPA